MPSEFKKQIQLISKICNNFVCKAPKPKNDVASGEDDAGAGAGSVKNHAKVHPPQVGGANKMPTQQEIQTKINRLMAYCKSHKSNQQKTVGGKNVGGKHDIGKKTYKNAFSNDGIFVKERKVEVSNSRRSMARHHHSAIPSSIVAWHWQARIAKTS